MEAIFRTGAEFANKVKENDIGILGETERKG